MQKSRVVQIAAGTAGVALIVGACASSSDSSTSPSASAAPTSAAPTTAAPTSAAPTTPATALPAPPAGSKELDNKSSAGVQYARYSNGSMTPEQVGKSYESEVKAAGYTVTKSGGGGGGWGGYGGADYGLEANKSGSYFAAQSGGEKNSTTYFEVCLGSDEAAVDQCEKNSKDASSGGS